jgi:hypothetical protein
MRECRDHQFCKLPEGICDLNDAPGICIAPPRVCSDDYDFVCGCDGVTYSNECYAAAAGISIRHHGQCEP